MNYRNKLMSLSLIALAAFSACSDEVENGTHPGKGDQRLSFAVSMGGANVWKPTGGTRAAAAPAAQELDPIEMQGKVNGESVYLTAEVTDGFPGDNRPMTRGTQISETNKTAGVMDTFAISAYTAIDGTPDFMYNEKVILKKDEGRWYPEGNFYWPGKKQLNFYAWFPSAADGMTLTGNTEPGAPVMTYIVPGDVKKQQDVMSAKVIGKDNPTADGYATVTDLNFNHALSAVKFVTGDNFAECTVNSITIHGVKYKGTYDMGTESWTLKDETHDFSLTFDGGKELDGTEGVAITDEGQTFFMMPQVLGDNAMIEVDMTIENTTPSKLYAKLSSLTTSWEKGKTYTYHFTTNKVTVNVAFFKGVNGTDGNPYTAHDISANGDPCTINYQYPAGVTTIKARLAYELTDADGNKTYKAFSEEYDLKGTTTNDSIKFTSPTMNNLYGKSDNAFRVDTPFVAQIKVTSSMLLTMPSDPANPDIKCTYAPGTDDEKWYTVWRGRMFPPNYISNDTRCPRDCWYNVVSREDGPWGTLIAAKIAAKAYWEVNENHPKYGKGKWWFADPFWGVNACYKSAWIYDMGHLNSYPGGNSLYGEKNRFDKGDHGYWTSGMWGSSGSTIYYVINTSWWRFFEFSTPSNILAGTHIFTEDQTDTNNCRFCIFSATPPEQW